MPKEMDSGMAVIRPLDIGESVGEKLAKLSRQFLGREALEPMPLHEVIVLGDETILVQSANFTLAYKTAVRYYNHAVKGFRLKQLKWQRLFKRMLQTEQSTETSETAAVAGFKFYLGSDDGISINEFMPQEFYHALKVNLDDYIIRKTVGTKRYIKLLGLVNNDVNLTREVLYNLCEELAVNAGKQLINQIIAHQYNWVQVGEPLKHQLSKPKLKLHTNETQTELYLKVEAPSGAGVQLRIADIEKLLKGREIQVPLLEEELKKFFQNRDFKKSVLIARSQNVVHGKDAWIEEMAELAHIKRNQELLAAGGKQLKQVTSFVTVKEGELIARKHPPEAGIDGYDIYGNATKAISANDLLFKGGKYTKLSEAGLTLTATINGNLYRDSNNLWTVGNILEVQNVNARTGSIFHLGTVLVIDSINDGYSVVASGNVHVGGSVGVGSIEAGGDIVIIKGVSGKNKASIVSHFGNIRAKFLQDAIITTEGNVMVEELISNCTIDAGNKVEVMAHRGTIWGGVVRATELISTSNLGSVSGRKTIVEVGVPFAIRVRLNKCKLEMEHIRKQVLETNSELTRAKDTDNGEEVTRLSGELKQYDGELKGLETERRNILANLEDHYVQAKVVIKQLVQANTIVQCQAASVHNRRYRNSLIFYAEAGLSQKIRIDPYVYKKHKQLLV